MTRKQTFLFIWSSDHNQCYTKFYF